LRALLDTSVFIAQEQGRDLAGPLPDEVAISVVTLSELKWGVLMADDDPTREQREKTLAEARQFDAFSVDEDVAYAFADLRAALVRAGRTDKKVQDMWIAATAIVQDVPVCTQDDDYDAMPNVAVLRV
jgi:predicted nucleic acid-binding protein